MIVGQSPYQPPQATLGGRRANRGSPRRRFWIAALAWIPLSAVAFGLAFSSEPGMATALGLLFLGWLGAVLWVGNAHAAMSGNGALGARLTLVAVGLTIALVVASLFGLALCGAITWALGVSFGGA